MSGVTKKRTKEEAQNDKVVKLVSGGSVINGGTPSSLSSSRKGFLERYRWTQDPVSNIRYI